MGFEDLSYQLDAAVSMDVLKDLRPLIGDLPAELVETRCRRGEAHVGIRLGDGIRGYHDIYRCQFRWWVRSTTPSPDGRATLPPFPFSPARPFMTMLRRQAPRRIVARLNLG